MAVLVLGAASAAASAEGLEETYAKLCGNGQKNETCDTLRKGLLEKLTRESGGGAGAAVPVAAQAQQILPGQQTTGPIAAAALSPNRDLMTTLSSDQRPLDPRWGVLARLVGTQWASDDVGDKNPKLPRVYRHFVSFSWLDGGEAIEIQDGIELTKAAPAIIVVLRPASQPGTFDGEIRQPKVAKRWQTKFRTDETGAVVSDWYKVIDAGHGLREMHARRGYRLMPDGSLAQVGANGWEKDRPAMRDPNDPELVKHRLRPYAASDLSALIKEQIASYPDLIEMEKQTETMQARLAQMQQERAARKASSGGLLGALIGAAVGAYAGTAAGLDTAQVAGAMMKGMSVTAPQKPARRCARRHWHAASDWRQYVLGCGGLG